MKKLTKNEFNLKMIKQQGRRTNLEATKVAPTSIRKSKKVYTRKDKYKKQYEKEY